MVYPSNVSGAHPIATELARKVMTFRAAILGIILAVMINVWVKFSEYAIRSSLMTIAHLPVVVVFPLFIVTAIVNPVLTRMRLAKPLSTPELFVIFSMGLIASAIPGFGFSNYFFRVIIPPITLLRQKTSGQRPSSRTCWTGWSPETETRRSPGISKVSLQARAFHGKRGLFLSSGGHCW